jgi:hypothetical protein
VSIPREARLVAARAFLASPKFAAATTTAAVAVGILANAIERTIGLGGLLGMLIALVALVGASILARFNDLKWQGLPPISLMAFVVWAGLSVFWSQYQWATLGGVAYLLAFTALAVAVALTRDIIQIVRAFGDVFRFVLALSFAVEIIAGALIDSPIEFLAVQGNLAELGPLQGVMGSRNQFALIGLLALITFAIEFITKSVSRSQGLASLGGAVLALALSRSPVMGAVLVVVAAAAVALALIRKAKPEHRTVLQLVIVGLALVFALVAWITRGRIIEIFSANRDLTYRLELWNRVWDLSALHPIEGWGWIGAWQPTLQPFPIFSIPGERQPTSAFNAYLDVLFQLGVVGVVLFGVLVVLAFTRSWLLAGRHRTVVLAWPALTLLSLMISSLAESSLLGEYGWFTFVVCAVKASQQLSWRTALMPALQQEPLDE